MENKAMNRIKKIENSKLEDKRMSLEEKQLIKD